MREREVYVDNIRIFLTILVILHHTAITYGAPGGWYYNEGSDGVGPKILLTTFVAVNQSFFMGMFFMLSAYFIPASYAKKGIVQFLTDRFKRLGVPIIFYSLVLSPLTVFALIRLHYDQQVSLVDFYANQGSWINLGVLWFTAALLLFTVAFVLLNKLKAPAVRWPAIIPSDKMIFLFGLILGVISFVIRLKFPIGWTLEPLGFQFAHFTQYISLFMVGIVAHRQQWLSQLTTLRGKKWRRIALLTVLAGVPLLYFISLRNPGNPSAFFGGFTTASFVNSIWEQLLGISLIVGILGLGKARWNKQNALMKHMSRSAYAVYIIHPLVLVVISLLLKDLNYFSLLKFLITGSLTIVVSFTISFALTKVPGIRSIL